MASLLSTNMTHLNIFLKLQEKIQDNDIFRLLKPVCKSRFLCHIDMGWITHKNTTKKINYQKKILGMTIVLWACKECCVTKCVEQKKAHRAIVVGSNYDRDEISLYFIHSSSIFGNSGKISCFRFSHISWRVYGPKLWQFVSRSMSKRKYQHVQLCFFFFISIRNSITAPIWW